MHQQEVATTAVDHVEKYFDDRILNLLNGAANQCPEIWNHIKAEEPK